MKIDGVYSFTTAPERVWGRLLDPEALRSCIPGCTELVQTGPEAWTATLTVGAGPVRGTYTGRIGVTEKRPFEAYRLAVEGRGGSGVVKGSALVTLTPDGEGTRVTVDADAQAGGTVAAVGQRMLASVAKMLMGQFFGCLRAGLATEEESRTQGEHVSTE